MGLTRTGRGVQEGKAGEAGEARGGNLRQRQSSSHGPLDRTTVCSPGHLAKASSTAPLRFIIHKAGQCGKDKTKMMEIMRTVATANLWSCISLQQTNWSAFILLIVYLVGMYSVRDDVTRIVHKSKISFNCIKKTIYSRNSLGVKLQYG